VTVGERVEPFFTLHFPQPRLTLIEPTAAAAAAVHRARRRRADETRYQTVFARNRRGRRADGRPAFRRAAAGALDAMGVERATLTLHVGAGTFQPVRVENLAEHRMHSEWYDLPQSLVDKIAATARAAAT
jgi:S-adenosylmethionine:tRNA ribosyltransferase-isomerase